MGVKPLVVARTGITRLRRLVGRSVFADLASIGIRALEALGARRITRVYLPEPAPDATRTVEFGLLELDDGSAGLYYAWLGPGQQDMPHRFPPEALVGRDPMELIAAYATGDDAERSLAMAGMNAVTASVWRASGYVPPMRASSFGLNLVSGDTLGMVGHFPPLVRQARELGVPVYVLERKVSMVNRGEGFEITLDPGVLGQCNKVVCTAATLLNNSLEEALGHCVLDATVSVVGPTASFFPEPLFARGVSAVGGVHLVDVDAVLRGLRMGESFGDTVSRYLLTPENYPGTEFLLQRAKKRGT